MSIIYDIDDRYEMIWYTLFDANEARRKFSKADYLVKRLADRGLRRNRSSNEDSTTKLPKL